MVPSPASSPFTLFADAPQAAVEVTSWERLRPVVVRVPERLRSERFYRVGDKIVVLRRAHENVMIVMATHSRRWLAASQRSVRY